jgi:exopolysaccharide production protein ExoF
MKRSNIIAIAAALTLLSPAAAHAEQYLLGVQDSLRIYVAEWPVLSGPVVVGAGGEISLPVIGQVQAANLDTAQLGQLIAQRLMEVEELPELPSTSVEVVAYRPFYILGSVTSPGEYNYRPGMLILNALSIAGGAYRAPDRSQWEIERVTISSSGELSVLNLRYQDLLAQQLRLSAERDGLEVLPPAPAEAQPELLRALEEQQRILDGNSRRRASAIASLQVSILTTQKEIEALDRQAADVTTRRQSVEAELERVRELVKKDLAVQRLAPLETTLADVQRQQQEGEIARLRAEQALADLRRQFDEIDQVRQTDLLAEIQRVNAELREVQQQRSALSRLLSGAAYYSAEAASSGVAEAAPQLRYLIVRAEGEKTTEIEVTETARVLPGDIIKVLRAADSAPAAGP